MSKWPGQKPPIGMTDDCGEKKTRVGGCLRAIVRKDGALVLELAHCFSNDRHRVELVAII
ncbi:hypothetical protein [Fuscibacter oryzae]|nr:hypothetical protein [Fuscibacter oryzae]